MDSKYGQYPPQQQIFNPAEYAAKNGKQMNENDAEEKVVTTVNDLKRYSYGAVVRLPDFSDGQPFVVKLRRPSLMVLAKSGKIPNRLMSVANSLFTEGSGSLDSDDTSMLSNIYDIMCIIAEASLIQPTWDEISNAGIELSDEQFMAIFNYSQRGVKALEPFR